mgnify:CR=1 FL=1
MDVIWQGLKEGFLLIIAMDPEIVQITLLSIQVSVSALLLAAIIGIPPASYTNKQCQLEAPSLG